MFKQIYSSRFELVFKIRNYVMVLNSLSLYWCIWVILDSQVVRKRRSKTFCISDCRKISFGLPKAKDEASASASSCLSSGSSSALSSGRSRDAIRRHDHRPLLSPVEDSKPKPIIGSGHMRRRAEAILKVLTAHGSVSEVRIRELLGDSPSTSKALRMWAKRSSPTLHLSHPYP